MKVIVPIKRVIDAYVAIQVKRDETGVETENVKMSMNPFDEIAIEEAVRLKEAGLATEVIAVTIGSEVSVDILRNALAIGADRAVLVENDDELQPLAVAKILKKVAIKESPDLIILGKQAIDNDNNQTGQMLAALLGWPQGTFISEQKIEDGWINITREIDGGLQKLRLKLPAVITTDLRLNEPRYIKLPNMMKAKKKPIENISINDFIANNDINNKFVVNKTQEPPQRKAGIIVDNIDELINKLRDEAKVI